MALPAFDSKQMLGKLRGLSIKGQRALGALCCGRLVPNFVAFQQEAGWLSERPLQYALDLVWADIAGREASPAEASRLIGECELAAPSSDDFSNLRVTSAQDACFAICSLLDHLVSPDPEQIVRIATYATDSIDLFVQETEGMRPTDPNLESMILMHPLMQQELARQEQDLGIINRILASGIDADLLLAALRRGDEKGNLAVGS